MTRENCVIDVRLAKAVLENEEGMNHLWIHLEPLGVGTEAALELLLPPGVYWDKEAYGLPTDNKGRIVLNEPDRAYDLVLGIYTEQPICCSTTSLDIVLTLKDDRRFVSSHCSTVPLRIVDGEWLEGNAVEMDEEVVRRVKEREACKTGRSDKSDKDSELLDCSPVKLIRYDPHYRSVLEEKYRVIGNEL